MQGGEFDNFVVDVVAVHRDHLRLWSNGAPLLSLSEVNGAGQGDRRHRVRRKKTYGEDAECLPLPGCRSA